jgi:hypothetical protein
MNPPNWDALGYPSESPKSVPSQSQVSPKSVPSQSQVSPKSVPSQSKSVPSPQAKEPPKPGSLPSQGASQAREPPKPGSLPSQGASQAKEPLKLRSDRRRVVGGEVDLEPTAFLNVSGRFVLISSRVTQRSLESATSSTSLTMDRRILASVICMKAFVRWRPSDVAR